MLVLSRKKGEQIVIGNNIVVTVNEIRGGNVRLGVEAPGEVPVHRQELYDKIKSGNGQNGKVEQRLESGLESSVPQARPGSLRQVRQYIEQGEFKRAAQIYYDYLDAKPRGQRLSESYLGRLTRGLSALERTETK